MSEFVQDCKEKEKEVHVRDNNYFCPLERLCRAPELGLEGRADFNTNDEGSFLMWGMVKGRDMRIPGSGESGWCI